MNKVILSNSGFSYNISRLLKVFFARFIDFIISTIPAILFIIFYKSEDLVSSIIVTSTGLSFQFAYFVLLAWICKGNTPGKYILGIRLIKNGEFKIKFLDVFLRELYYTFLPTFVQIIAQYIGIIFLTYLPKGYSFNYAVIIKNISYIFFIIWYLYIILSMHVQEFKQSGVDAKLNIYIVLSISVEDSKKNKKVEKLITRDEEHIHLKKDQPGNLDDNILERVLEVNEDPDDVKS